MEKTTAVPWSWNLHTTVFSQANSIIYKSQCSNLSPFMNHKGKITQCGEGLKSKDWRTGWITVKSNTHISGYQMILVDIWDFEWRIMMKIWINIHLRWILLRFSSHSITRATFQCVQLNTCKIKPVFICKNHRSEDKPGWHLHLTAVRPHRLQTSNLCVMAAIQSPSLTQQAEHMFATRVVNHICSVWVFSRSTLAVLSPRPPPPPH